MCTLTFAWQAFADAPLVVAANRDESFDRPATGPQRIEDELALVAPRDEEAGGTWIGYNERGVFAGITNRWVPDAPEGERSRGLLMRDVLRQTSAQDAARLVEREVAERVYSPFNLVIADGLGGIDDPGEGFTVPTDAERTSPITAVLIEYDGDFRSTVLEPGVHVVVNVGADGSYRIPSDRAEIGERQARNADELRTHLTPEPGESATEWRERARAAIRDHDFDACIHGDGFGTRSSSVLTFGEGGVRYEFAPGPPCTTDYEDVDATI